VNKIDLKYSLLSAISLLSLYMHIFFLYYRVIRMYKVCAENSKSQMTPQLRLYLTFFQLARKESSIHTMIALQMEKKSKQHIKADQKVCKLFCLKILQPQYQGDRYETGLRNKEE